jgi:hypothetical protein
MWEFLFEHWPIVERAASVAALLEGGAIYWLVRELGRTRCKFEDSQEKRIVDAKSIIEVTTQNTGALNSLKELIKDRRR